MKIILYNIVDINNLDVWILSTDYETYALGYSCIDEGPGGYW